MKFIKNSLIFHRRIRNTNTLVEIEQKKITRSIKYE